MADVLSVVSAEDEMAQCAAAIQSAEGLLSGLREEEGVLQERLEAATTAASTVGRTLALASIEDKSRHWMGSASTHHASTGAFPYNP